MFTVHVYKPVQANWLHQLIFTGLLFRFWFRSPSPRELTNLTLPTLQTTWWRTNFEIMLTRSVFKFLHDRLILCLLKARPLRPFWAKKCQDLLNTTLTNMFNEHCSWLWAKSWHFLAQKGCKRARFRGAKVWKELIVKKFENRSGQHDLKSSSPPCGLKRHLG